MLDLTGKTAIVTGAGGAIGGACASILHSCGANLVLTDIDEAAVRSLAMALDPAGKSAIGARQDVAMPSDAQAVVKLAAETFGGIDILVVGAGIYCEKSLREMSDEEWRSVLSVNLDGAFFALRAAIPHLRPGGSIVTICSMAGHKGSRNHGHYAAAKGGLLALTRSAALELAPDIRVNAVSPGLIDTSMIDTLFRNAGASLLAQTPLNRLGLLDEVAGAVLFLCSDLSSFVTGETLHVNGGLYVSS